MSASILAIADIVEDALMHREMCPHAGRAAYERVHDISHLLKEGSLGADEARHLALAALKVALDTPRLPDALSKRAHVVSLATERRHAFAS